MTEFTEFTLVLMPSPLSGIGVFAAQEILKGTHLFTASFKTRKIKIKEVPPAFIKYCIFINDEYCTCPERFDRMEIGWFLNHSHAPNITKDAAGNVIASRTIHANEELFLNYNQLNEPEHLKEAYYRNSQSE